MGLWDVKRRGDHCRKQPGGDGRYQIARFTNNRIGWFNRYKLGGLQSFSSPGWDQEELVDIYGWWIQPCIEQSQKKTGLCQLQAAMHGAERGFNTAWCHICFSFSQAFLEMWSNDYKKLRHILKNYEKSLNKSKFLAAWIWCSLLGCCFWEPKFFSIHRPSCSAGGADVVRHSPGDPEELTTIRGNGTKPYGTMGFSIYGCSNLGLFQ